MINRPSTDDDTHNMLKATLRLENKLGLHIRASSTLVNCASKYLSNIEIRHNKKTANAKHIFEVMLLGATQGDALDFILEGPDETEALQALTTLIANKFGEAE